MVAAINIHTSCAFSSSDLVDLLARIRAGCPAVWFAAGWGWYLSSFVYGRASFVRWFVPLMTTFVL